MVWKTLSFSLSGTDGCVRSLRGAVGGAVGAVVGAPLGAAAGIVGGIAGALTPKFHHYVVEERIPSYVWEGHPQVVVGDMLPAEGVVLHPVPRDYGVTEYRYALWITPLCWLIPGPGGWCR